MICFVVTVEIAARLFHVCR